MRGGSGAQNRKETEHTVAGQTMGHLKEPLKEFPTPPKTQGLLSNINIKVSNSYGMTIANPDPIGG